MVTDITYDNLDIFAYTNEKLLTAPPRGICLEVQGLNACYSIFEDPPRGVFLAEQGILHVIPYTNPWSWLNDRAFAWTEHILAIMIDRCFGSVQPRLCVIGDSMGGYEALVFTAKTRYRVDRCCVNCPVTDLETFTQIDRSRAKTVFDAFDDAPDVWAAIREHSPLRLIDRMPKIPYYMVQCTGDNVLQPEIHAERYYAAAAEKMDISFDIDPGREHCDLSPAAREKYDAQILKTFEN